MTPSMPLLRGSCMSVKTTPPTVMAGAAGPGLLAPLTGMTVTTPANMTIVARSACRSIACCLSFCIAQSMLVQIRKPIMDTEPLLVKA